MHNNKYFSQMIDATVRDVGHADALWQLLAFVVALGVAYGLARLLRARLDMRRRDQHVALRFGAESFNKALFPLLGWLLVAAAQLALTPFLPTPLLQLALVPLAGIALIYIVFYFARRVFTRNNQAPALLYVFEKVVTVLIWVGMALTVTGIQDDVLRWMASVRFNFAHTHMTLLSLATGILWVFVTLVVALWAGAAFEDRMMRSPTLEANLRVVLARIGRAGLILGALLISLSLVGIDVTVLGVFGGALGVGLGFGLQKIASNYVSGFIILLDRSLRLGDLINVGGTQGVVTQIHNRYTVVRGLNAVETLIPNEKLITDVVQNHSSFLTRGYSKASVQISYAADVDLAMRLLLEATAGLERILLDPPPAAYLVGFGADGINLELGFWVADAATGVYGVCSSVNYNIWAAFKRHGIDIPHPQREVRILNAGWPPQAGAVFAAESVKNTKPGLPVCA